MTSRSWLLQLSAAGQAGSAVRCRRAGFEAAASQEGILLDSGKHGFAFQSTFYRELQDQLLNLSELQCLLIKNWGKKPE